MGTNSLERRKWMSGCTLLLCSLNNPKGNNNCVNVSLNMGAANYLSYKFYCLLYYIYQIVYVEDR